MTYCLNAGILSVGAEEASQHYKWRKTMNIQILEALLRLVLIDTVIFVLTTLIVLKTLDFTDSMRRIPMIKTKTKQLTPRETYKIVGGYLVDRNYSELLKLRKHYKLSGKIKEREELQYALMQQIRSLPELPNFVFD